MSVLSIPMPAPDPRQQFIGEWNVWEEASFAVFRFSLIDDGLAVTFIDDVEGVENAISDVRWNTEEPALYFTVQWMKGPTHRYRISPDADGNTLEVSITASWVETWAPMPVYKPH
jgi:hypothetical protein